jgi:fatty-acyl-CoA synthase
MSNIINRDTIGDMARRAATKYGDKTAIVFRDLKLSFYDLEREARRFANLMTSYGIGKGDRVAVYAYNSHYYPISMLGLAKIGAIQVPINYMLNAEEIAYITNHSGSRLFIVEDALYPMIAATQGQFSTVERWGFIPLGDAIVPEGYFNLVTEMQGMATDEPQVEVSAEDIVQIPYTSGTESKPKGHAFPSRPHVPVPQLYLRRSVRDGRREPPRPAPFHCAQLHCFLMPYLYVGPRTSSCTRQTL